MPKKITLKTKQSAKSVSTFIRSVDDEVRKKDCETLLTIMTEITGEKPKMWGPSIVGFGEYEYRRSNGDYGTFMRTGFSPRKHALTLYVMPGYDGLANNVDLEKLGPHKLGKSCLYIKKLDDVHLPTLKKIIRAGWKDMAKRYPKVQE